MNWGADIETQRPELMAANNRLVAALLAEGGFPTKVVLSDGRWALAGPDRRAWRPGRPVREADINMRQSWPVVEARPTSPRVQLKPEAGGVTARPAPPVAAPQAAKVAPKPVVDPAPHGVRLAAAIGELGRATAPTLALHLGWSVGEVKAHLIKLGVNGVLIGAGKDAAGERLWRLSGAKLSA